MMKYRPMVAVALVFALATAPVAAHAAAPAQPKPTAITPPLVTLESLVVDSIDLVGGQLVATATATLNVVGQTVTRVVHIPLTLGGTPAATADTCDILNLSLGPINLNLLGLIVNLDNCNNGPITVDITGDDSGLLGQLLCGLAGGLLGPIDLGGLLDILDALGAAEGLTVTGILTDLLNQLFEEILSTTPTPTGGHANGICPILDLEIPQGLHLSLLGLNVDTSPICLEISAQEGPGNLLGNLLCSLTDLLNNRGNTLNAQRVLIRNILRILAGL